MSGWDTESCPGFPQIQGSKASMVQGLQRPAGPPRPPEPFRGLPRLLVGASQKVGPVRNSDSNRLSKQGFQIRKAAPSTGFQAQTRSLFKIGSIQSGHHLKKRKASSHPHTQTGIRLVWTSPACRPKSNCSRLEASSQGTV